MNFQTRDRIWDKDVLIKLVIFANFLNITDRAKFGSAATGKSTAGEYSRSEDVFTRRNLAVLAISYMLCNNKQIV